MSVTTGTGAKKTAGTDNWRTIIGVHNDTVDVYDKVKAAAAIFAAPYDSTATYAAGDQCTHDGRWYVANQAISTAEDWTAAHWTEITIASKLDTANVYNGLDKTASGFALDARQGKSLNEAIANTQSGLAIVANGNTHAAIGAGQFVYVKGHGTLSDGLYTNTSGSTIAANATLSSSNLTADASGGLNSLNSNIDARLSDAKFITFATSSSTSVTINLPNGARSILLSSSMYGDCQGVCSIQTSSNGSVGATRMVGASDITFNISVSNKITISSANHAEHCLICIGTGFSKG